MTSEQKIEWLAVRVMGWKRYEPNRDTRGVSEPCFTILKFGGKEILTADYDGQIGVHWNPLTDWNAWRQAEEKVMEDEHLHKEFVGEVCRQTNDDDYDYSICDLYMKANPPTRCRSLYLAYQSMQ